ncbi:unnamed protein product [Brachionus calyciflorus]|uniref:Uncharacterized protein n=1 Tax=Brachionus calyciflorus TaxID=104777 RepID=A0A813Y1L1_9BILA|nr:unnamed protein product [Brachionus calyciflorus]
MKSRILIDSLVKIGWSSLLIFQAISYGSYTILVHLCEENGQITFSSTSLNLIIEFLKLIVSILGIFFQINKNKFKSLSTKKSVYFSIPAFLYFINNNLAVYIQLFMDSTSYQMLSNLKIFTTAILYYLIIGKRISKIKWFSLTLLFASGVFYSIANLKSLSSYYIDEKDLESFLLPSDETVKSAKYRLRDEIYITEIGLFMILIYAIISGFSGVYNEYLLKLNNSDSIFEQNFYLYTYGCLFNLIGFYFEKSFVKNENLNLFTGLNFYAFLIVFTQVFNGFLMSIVMKHSSNITRLFVVSCSLIVTTVLSIFVFSLKLNLYFYFGFFSIMLALYLYVSYE